MGVSCIAYVSYEIRIVSIFKDKYLLHDPC
jgi:hypothetical protein